MMDHNKKENYVKFPKINQPLHFEYVNYAELYLPGKLAYQYAKKFENIPNHQIRKILDTVKIALKQSDKDFENAKKQMFMLVAMSAYNAGRMPKKLKVLYYFLSNTINEQSIKSKKDIEAFDQFFTSVVAYHKLFDRNQDRGKFLC